MVFTTSLTAADAMNTEQLESHERPTVVTRPCSDPGPSFTPGSFVPRMGSVERPRRGHLLEAAEHMALEDPRRFPTVDDALAAA